MSEKKIIFDHEAFMRHLDGNAEFAQEMIHECIVILPKYLSNLQSAIDSQNSDTIKKSAHKTRGGLSTLFAINAARISFEIETLAAEGDVDACRKTLPALVSEVDDLKIELTQFLTTL